MSTATCPYCGGSYALTLAGRFRSHRRNRATSPDGNKDQPICGASGYSPAEAAQYKRLAELEAKANQR